MSITIHSIVLGLIIIKQRIVDWSPFPPLLRMNNYRKGNLFPAISFIILKHINKEDSVEQAVTLIMEQ